jgi:uncharacterized membrane protein YgcG
VRSLIGPLPAAMPLPDVHQFLGNQRQREIQIWDFMANEQEEMSSDPRNWDRPAVHMSETDRKKKQAVSGEASGSGSGSGSRSGYGRLGGSGRRAGSGRRVGYSAEHKQREEPD